MASIRTRTLADGTTSYHVLWRTPDRRQTSMTFVTQRQAENFRRMLDATRGDGDAALTMLQAVEQNTPLVVDVLAEHIKGLSGITARTREDYRRLGARYITPELGALHIDTITPQHIRDWINELADSDLSDKTIANVHGLLSAMFSTAAERGYRTDNPSKGTRLPRRGTSGRGEMVVLTHDEWRAIDGQLTYADGRYRDLFRTLAGTGARWGEVTALQARDYHPGEVPMLRIERAVKRAPDNSLFISSTKTRRSERTISLDPATADLLAGRAAGRAPTDLLFAAPEGGLQRSGRIYELVWMPAVERAAIGKRPRIHDLRHSHASWLIAAGVDMLTVQRRLGHESITTTADRYSHLLPGQQRAAAEAISRVWG